MTTSTAEIGAFGEQQAVDWLRGNGYAIIARNWRSGHYEIDIVAQKGDCLHFVEVKCRKAHGLTSPEDAVTPKKINSLVRAINQYILLYGTECDVQIDLVAVEFAVTGVVEVRFIPDVANLHW